MNLFQHNGTIDGSPECPCIQPDNLNFLHCDKNYTQLEIGAPMGYNLSNIPCSSENFGGSCKHHDLSFFPECSESTEMSLASRWCHLKWCFIDADTCFPTQQEYEQFPLGTELYVSFSTCGKINKLWNPTESEEDSIKNFVFEAVFADYEYPFHYIEEENEAVYEYSNGKAYNGSGTMQGILVDYLEELSLRSSIKQINLNLPSGGSRTKYSSSSYTAAVRDVGLGIFDVGVGLFYLTTDRLKLSSFTVPIYETPFYLYELNTKSYSKIFAYNIQKTFKPFTQGLLFVLVGVIFAVAIANIFISDERGDHSAWYQAVRNENWNQSSKARRFIIYSQVVLDSLINSQIHLYGQATNVSNVSTMAQKILAVGFGFFILVVTASYTANLATFLTLQKAPDLIPSMEVAIEKRKKICAPAAIEDTLNGKYGGNVFYFVRGLPYLTQAIEYMRNGNCDAIAAEHLEVTTILKDVCDHNLISMKTLVVNVPMGFPVNTRYKSTFSHAMMKLQEKDITIDDMIKPYEKSFADCPLYAQNEISTENTPMVMINLLVPILVLFMSMIVATCIKLTKRRRPKIFVGFQKQNQTIVEDEDNNKSYNGIKSDNETTNSDKLGDGLNLLEYKYRLDLLRHRMNHISIEIDEVTDESNILGNFSHTLG